MADLPFKCPAAPYEAALLLEAGFRKRGVRGQIQIELFTPEPQPMPVAGVAVGAALTQVLDDRGITLHPERRLSAVDPEHRRLRFEDGEADYDLLVYVPPHRSADPVRESSLATEAGWIPVDAATLATTHPNVYAIGDTAAVSLANGMLLPKAGVFAHEEGRVVARRIADAIAGRPASATFSGRGGCFVEMGDGTAAYGSGEFLAQPAPHVTLAPATRSWRWGKVAFERTWLAAISGPPRRSRLAWRALDWGPKALERRWLWRWV